MTSSQTGEHILDVFERVVTAPEINHREAASLLYSMSRNVLAVCETRRKEQIVEPWIRAFSFFERRLRPSDMATVDSKQAYLHGRVESLLIMLELASQISLSQATIDFVTDTPEVLHILQYLQDHDEVYDEELIEALHLKPENFSPLLRRMHGLDLIHSPYRGKRSGIDVWAVSSGFKGKATLDAAMQQLSEREKEQVSAQTEAIS